MNAHVSKWFANAHIDAPFKISATQNHPTSRQRERHTPKKPSHRLLLMLLRSERSVQRDEARDKRVDEWMRQRCVANKRPRENRTVKTTKYLNSDETQTSVFFFSPVRFDWKPLHRCATHMCILSHAQQHTNNRTGAGVGGGGSGGTVVRSRNDRSAILTKVSNDSRVSRVSTGVWNVCTICFRQKRNKTTKIETKFIRRRKKKIFLSSVCVVFLVYKR